MPREQRAQWVTTPNGHPLRPFRNPTEGGTVDVLDDEGFVPAVMSTPIGSETCDHCGPAVRAYLFVVVNGTELAYCGSCGTRYFDKLVQTGTVIVDMRHQLHDN